MSIRAHRATIGIEQAPVLSHQAFAGDQHVLRLQAPECARSARPGTFVHLQCDPLLPLRRPLSIQRADPEEGWIELLYKAVGHGTRLLAKREVGDTVDLLGPIGEAFEPSLQRPRPLLIGGGVGIPPMIFLADNLQRLGDIYRPLVLMGSEVPFPFETRRSALSIPGIEAGIDATLALLEDWGVPCRLSSSHGFAGCHRGLVTELATGWLEQLKPQERNEVEIFACGPHPMLEAVTGLARRFGLRCQVSLEEFMACAVGGCAGCTVEISTERGAAMKRVCVDGPVFDGHAVFPA